MSATIGVEGLKPKTEEYEKKLQIYKLCEELLIEPPAEIIKFFHGKMCEDGIVTEIPSDALNEYRKGCKEIIDVDLTKLPDDIKTLRFYLC